MDKELKITESVSVYGRKIVCVNEPSKEIILQVMKRLIDIHLDAAAKEMADKLAKEGTKC